MTTHSCANFKGVLNGNYGPLTRYVKLRVVPAPGMPGTFFPHRLQSKPLVSDHGTCVTIAGVVGNTCPAFPAHAQPAILRIWHVMDEQLHRQKTVLCNYCYKHIWIMLLNGTPKHIILWKPLKVNLRPINFNGIVSNLNPPVVETGIFLLNRPWLLASTGYRPSWYQLWKAARSLSSMRKYFNYLYYLCAAKS